MGNNIPQGYKATALGIIPQEWEVMRLGDIVSITSGESPSLYHLKAEGKYPYVKVEDLNNCEKYQESSREYSDDNNTTIKAGSIIFPKRGASILNNKVRIAAKDIQMDSNMMAITPHTTIVDTEFLYIRILHERLYRIADTSSIPQINNKHIIPYKIAVPPLAEQRKIAEVLGVWDEAIEKQARLIEKLALRKRALMQRLLSAKLRLPGFSEPWQKVKLGEICERVTRKNIEDNQNVMTISAQCGFVAQTDFFNKSVASETLESYYLVFKDEFCYNKSYSNGYPMGAIKRLSEADKAVVTSLYICFNVKPETNTNIDYLSYYFDNGGLNRGLTKIANEGGRAHGLLNVTPKDFFGLSFEIPSLKEQTAIAEVLIAADREIELAKEKLERLRRQKRGLMQQLLSGKKRVKINI
ncbi:restriction endonuclease subunit S [Alistipes sp. CHKCI003]|mgnify:CR=1 FL=1|uniref:restriction endonuclease subunit S n=1 Tax=Alistipes sp. CHKCI003 TaxID=1780376 RepID=UPI0007A80128|nr:restriction endonuclease subunit S [Alistipes sp. CHKCI003]CVI67437.1 EcoKI restriction-modification system protein HsdS [Alistipes sp. CHKCI003]